MEIVFFGWRMRLTSINTLFIRHRTEDITS